MNLKLAISITQLLFGAAQGYCNWGSAGTGASSTCDGQVQGGDWCNAGQGNCEAGCGGRWCTNSGGGGVRVGSKCGCNSCTTSVLGRNAGGFPVGGRIDWVMANMGQSEQDACSTVCGDEFSNVCGDECNPSQCGSGGGGVGGGGVPPAPTPPPPSPPSSTGAFCGCSTCSQTVWDAFAGDYTCGARITWLQNSQGYGEDKACSAVTSEFPGICRCDPSCDGNPPTPTPPTPTPPTGNPPTGNPRMDIRDQGSGTVQVVNESSETNLHVFFQSNNVWERWIKVDGDGVINNPINWGQDGTNAFDPLGAKKLSEAVIPKGGSIVLTIPDLNPPQFQIIAIKMVDPSRQAPLPPSKSTDWNGPAPREVIHGQWPVLIEGGKDVVADASAVDGINFRMKYELTTSETEVQMMEITENPCRGLAEKYLVRGPNNSLAGCRSPPKVDCDGNKPGETCDCHPNTQNCKFNECSVKEFDIPNNLMQYLHVYDNGDHTGLPVKGFINDESNIKRNSDFDKYCKQMHSDTRQNGGESDFTCYCYDYNDVASSPWLRAPYKIKVVYFDL